jgi:NAD(P)H-quinone oxidoreductase subunit 4
LTTSDAYSGSFKIVVVLLSAIAIMLTPIYLLSMLRRVFYGAESSEVVLDAWVDAKPRELFITVCLLIPIIGIGFYPKIATQTYDVTTVAMAEHLQSVLPVIAQTESKTRFSQVLSAPQLMTIAGR